MLKVSLRRMLIAAASVTALQLAVLPGAAIAQEPTAFTVTIRNVATDTTLKLPNGGAINAPIAPGAFAILSDGAALFSSLKGVAGTGLETLAEDGNPEPLIAAIAGTKGVKQAGLILPGQPVTITAEPGDRIAFASMFVQSNDLFYAPDPRGIALFGEDGRPINGDITAHVKLWDAGTEQNEAPGAGENQAPRQAKPNTGTAENGVVHGVNDGFAYPDVVQVLRVEIAPE